VAEPEAQRQLKQAEERSARLALELEIARSCAAELSAREQLASLRGALKALADCQARDRELDRLERLADCRDKLATASAAVPPLESKVQECERALHTVEEQLARVDEEVETARAAKDAAVAAANAAERQL